MWDSVDSLSDPDGGGVDGEFQAAEDMVEEDAVFHAISTAPAAVVEDLLVGPPWCDGDCVRGGVVEGEVFVGDCGDCVDC